MSPETYCTVKEAAALLGVTRNSVDYFRKRGLLEAVRFPEAHNLVLIPRAQLQALIRERKRRAKRKGGAV